MRFLPLAFALLLTPFLTAADASEEWTDLAPERRSVLFERPKTFHVQGKIVDVFPDDIDTDYVFLVVDHKGEPLYAPVVIGTTPLSEFEKLIGAEVAFDAATTIVPTISRNTNIRLFTGPVFIIRNFSAIHVLQAPPDDLFDVPEIGNVSGLRPDEIGRLGRRRLTGRVLACWDKRSLLVETPDNQTIRVELAKPTPPQNGETVDVVGFLGTDVFRLNLNRAIWRPSARTLPRTDIEPVDVSLRELCRDANGKRRLRFKFHGKLVRLRGLVRSRPAPDDEDSSFVLEADGLTISIDTSAGPESCRALEIGATVEATGICVMDVDGWRPNDLFPPIRRLFLVLRTADDLRLVARPPWLTPTRAATILAVLLTALLGILVWNQRLRTLAERRGRALLKRELKGAQAESRLMERMRLAVELHDSIAQTLTGIALELETAVLSADAAPEELRRHLDIATRALDSCRDDLRNCLWDLRNDALDAPTMDEAIRRTLLPHVKDIRPAVRFNVPRARFNDNTAHAVLCVIRELVLNARRHGQASDIRVAGAVEGEAVSFSVQDNGCGFDPASAPGVAEGHFGLQGLRERIHQLGGVLTIVSAPGEGAKVTVRLKPNPVSEEATT